VEQATVTIAVARGAQPIEPEEHEPEEHEPEEQVGEGMRAPRIAVGASAADLDAGLERIRAEMKVPRSFPAAVLGEADERAGAGPVLPPGARRPHLDRRDLPLVTIDPPGSRDLDQAFHAERSARGFRVWYAIADVAAFVAPGGALDRESHARGETLYMPDRRAPVLPAVLSEGAASLLPGEDRVAVLWEIDLGSDGEVRSAHLRRSQVRSRGAFSYQQVETAVDAGTADEAILALREIGRLRAELQHEHGAVTLHRPEQEIVREGDRYGIAYRAPLPSEAWNEQISLLAGISAARIMVDGGVGILRTLPPPQPEVLERLRRVALALGIDWPAGKPYAEVVWGFDASTPRHAAFVTQASRIFRGASYVSIGDGGERAPVHSPIGSVYAHVTAPLRRVADRYANEVVLSLLDDAPVPEWVASELADLPATMSAADARAHSLDHAVIDLMEVLVLRPHVGDVFEATVVDGRDTSATVLLQEPAVVTSVPGRLQLGTRVALRLVDADPDRRRVVFEPSGTAPSQSD
jgi:exoribonuclease R